MRPRDILKHLFDQAIVRVPGSNFAEGLTSVNFGAPIHDLVLTQHARYCEALLHCGLAITTLNADLIHPDATFVEDTAVLNERSAVLTRPGASSRIGEVAAIRDTIRKFFPTTVEIAAPGTVDGGDICHAGTHYFLGLSHRSNTEGLKQLSDHLIGEGCTCDVIDIRGMKSILHLKSGISYVGNNTLTVIDELANHELFRKYNLIRIPLQESYAANCVRVNDRVLVAAGYPYVAAQLVDQGFKPLVLDMSEFRKMDGGLSCLSLRFQLC